MRSVASALVVLIGLASCEGKTVLPVSPDPGVSAKPVASGAASAPPAVSPTAAAPRVILPVDVTCATDVDCTMTDQEVVDAPPTYACCPGCAYHAGSKTWKAKFDAACKASAPQMCPPIGCPMQPQTPACVAKKCALK